MKRIVFIQFWYGAFNGAICFSENQWMFVIFHLFSVDQCVSLIFHESYSYLMFFVPAWVTFKLWKVVISYNFGMENLMQSVCSVHHSMFINFHLYSLDQCVFMIFHESYLMIFCTSMSDISIIKRTVFIQFWYGKFNGAICF